MRTTLRRSAIILLWLLASLTLPALAEERLKADYTDPVTGMEFMAIPGGTFIMGDDYDGPAHEVTVKPFLLGRFEVTFEQYAKFCASTGRPIPSDNGWGMADRPVINVSKQDSIDFSKWLSDKTGKTIRLPSEAEWEFAARGGATTRFPWGNELGKNHANCNDCGSQWDGEMTAPVGSFAPNGYGLHDMIGNVYEWVLDAWHRTYTGAPTDGSAWMTDADSDADLNRGGSWYQPAKEMAITRRCMDNAGRKRKEYGFRVLIELNAS